MQVFHESSWVPNSYWDSQTNHFVPIAKSVKGQDSLIRLLRKVWQITLLSQSWSKRRSMPRNLDKHSPRSKHFTAWVSLIKNLQTRGNHRLLHGNWKQQSVQLTISDFSLIHFSSDTEKENPYILDCIAKQDPVLKIFRLVCLQSLCNDGLRKNVYESYKKEILQVSVNQLSAPSSFLNTSIGEKWSAPCMRFWRLCVVGLRNQPQSRSIP